MSILAVEVTWQVISTAFVVAGVVGSLLGWGAWKFYGVMKTAAADAKVVADESLQKQAEGWKRLFEIEKANNEQLVRTVATLQTSYERLQTDIETLRGQMRDASDENHKLVALNIRHQETVRQLNHDKAGLQNALNLMREENDKLKTAAA